ncbi:PAQR family membrane homeostasis protein TrhA [Oceanobacillus massiliensis]|uniref:PAQR family membrane homeostasis protein TrhA n=1 Tax=Oceanobacillus massiliensis TaxID=1465765 RepID=UPI000287FA0E|nr:hemolysin III family protein [Oceanobacillus massiliensis]
MNKYIREPVNAFTHLFGAIMAIIGLIALIEKASQTSESSLSIVAVSVFGISMILLYAASASYHTVIAKDITIALFRRIDHAMIFVLIAGTYIPFCLISLNDTTGWILFWVISSIAIAGILFKLIWFHAPRWLSTILYIAMGWIVIFYSGALAPVIGPNGMGYLIAGGLFYTIGAFIYWLKPGFLSFKHMGFHEIFHIFILFGSLCHFICIYQYVL